MLEYHSLTGEDSLQALLTNDFSVLAMPYVECIFSGESNLMPIKIPSVGFVEL